MKPVPVMVTVVPPAGRPAAGLSVLMVGVPSKMNSSAGEVVLVPAGVVTVTSTVPAGSAGARAVTWVAELTL